MTPPILAAVDDMFFAAKIRAAAEALDVRIRFFRRLADLLAAAAEDTPRLILVDLHNEKVDPIALARELKSKDNLRTIPVLGFFSHVQTDLQRAAVAAGYDKVIPRSVFARDLPDLIKT